MQNEKKDEPSLETIGNNNMDHPHNEILFWAVEGGIIPFMDNDLIGLLIIDHSWSILNYDLDNKTEKLNGNVRFGPPYFYTYTTRTSILYLFDPLVPIYFYHLYDR